MSRPWDAEHLVDVGAARALIAAQFPALAPAHLRLVGEGWDNVAYVVDERWVFRFPRRGVAAALIERECAVLPVLAPALPLAVPVPRFVGRPGDGYPWPFAGYAVLSGAPADEIPLDDDGRAALAAPLAAFLRALHALDPAVAVAHGLEADRIGRLDHARRRPLVAERLGVLAAAGIVADGAPLLAALDACAPDVHAGRRCIVHGDLYLRHILLDDAQRATGVIDWGDVHLGDPAVDLAIAFLVLPARAHAAFRAAYGPVDDGTWSRARYRALYHAALQAAYGVERGDDAIAQSGRWALAALSR